jgi:hypothetical protein
MMEEKISHRHFCDYAGHDWQCAGTALRPLAGDAEPSVCMCPEHKVPMEEGAHGNCMVELLACPDHMDEQLRRMGYEPGTSNMPHCSEGAAGKNFFKDSDGNRTVGFCLWCNKDFYTHEEARAHHTNDSASCPVFQELRDQHCMPPALQMMFESAEMLDEDNGGNEPEKTDE